MFGRRPRGAWLAERVWEPSLPTALVAGGYDWTIVDDAHLRAASIPDEATLGPLLHRRPGQPRSRLRDRAGPPPPDPVPRGRRGHRLPARPRDRRRRAHRDDGRRRREVRSVADDHAHCWGDGGWVDRFFEALEANAEWLTTTTPSDWLAEHRPIGRAYIPTGSYEEMGEWALPADESAIFHAVLKDARAHGRPEAAGCAARRGGTTRSSTARSTTSTSRCSGSRTRWTRWPTGADRALALDHLYRGQSNDCYWHGLFGGVYIAHMRLATYHHLIAAEDLADTAARRLTSADVLDLDLDGQGRRPPGRARPGRHDRSRRGSRHRRLGHPTGAACADRGHAPAAGGVSPDAARARGGRGRPPTDEAASIHEIVAAKEADLADHLHYDPYERRSGLVRFLAPGTTARRLGGWPGCRAR